MQNVLVLNVPDANLSSLIDASSEAGLPLWGSPFQRGVVSCTGSEFCKLAITETKRFSVRLARELEARVPGFSTDVKLHVTGCPNSCGQHWIADVGLQGVLMTRGDEQIEGYDVFVGGQLGARGVIAHRVGVRVAADHAAQALERLFKAFAGERAPGERFGAWANRASDDRVRAALEGAPPENAG
jgi:sulfite reductase (ferredoxin)